MIVLDIAGSVRPSLDVAARTPRYYGHFSEPVLWPDVMSRKPPESLAFPKHEAARTARYERPRPGWAMKVGRTQMRYSGGPRRSAVPALGSGAERYLGRVPPTRRSGTPGAGS